MIELDWLQSFRVFSEQLNLTRAARLLHLSQPALHRQLALLAEGLGVPLYRRVGRRLELTAEGEQVACFGREVQELTSRFFDELRQGGDRRPVVLAAGEGAYLYLIGEAVRRFASSGRHPPLTLLTRDHGGSLEALRSGRAHLAVTRLDSLPPDLEATLLAESEPVLVLPEGHPLALPGPVTLEQLEGCRLVVPPADRPWRSQLAQALARARVNWEVAVEAGGWPLILHFVSLGLGLAVVNGFCRLPPGLVARPLGGLAPSRYYLLQRPAVVLRPAVAELRELLVECCRPA